MMDTARAQMTNSSGFTERSRNFRHLSLWVPEMMGVGVAKQEASRGRPKHNKEMDLSLEILALSFATLDLFISCMEVRNSSFLLASHVTKV